MKKFMDDDFLLQTPTAINLYNTVKDLPIIDYHCHLIPEQIATNKRFKNITEIWLYGDHYKWRAMRTNGINEDLITGNASDYDKFIAWAKTVEVCIGNPLYHWTHLELKRYFNYDGLLNSQTADEVWNHCNAILAQDDFCVNSILKKFNVEAVCTTDDPIDDLHHHQAIANNPEVDTTVLPTFRPSNAMNIEFAPFVSYINKLAEVSQVTITDYTSLITALLNRVDFFHANGCRLSDHSLDPIYFCEYTMDELNDIVKLALGGKPLTLKQIQQYKTAVGYDLGKKYYDLGWTMQLHICCNRNNNTRMFNILGADTGFDSIDDTNIGRPLINTLDNLNKVNKLPKTIIYSLNPVHNDLITTIIGGFQDGETRGKIQLGSGWWFNDQKDGMEKQMIALASNGLIACFVGMLTDSRSFLSYTRHEYFRRILCNIIGNWIENGEYPDTNLVSQIASDICYNNAKNYFQF